MIWSGPGRAVARSFRVAASRPLLAAAAVFGLSLAGSIGAGMLDGVRPPGVHDEFSYLLAAETFASGHLAEKSPPLWRHFETFHEIVHPVYASKYPPGQSIALALGLLLTGQAIWGVWLSLAAACVAIWWALRAVLPARWALVGGLLSTLRFGFFGYWAQSYWGGAVAALGGAIAMGAALRLVRRPSPIDAALFAVGLGICGNTRPYEGAILALILVTWTVVRLRRAGSAGMRAAVAFFAAALPIAAWMGFYNYQITGKPWELPYQLYERQYQVVNPVVFLPRINRAAPSIPDGPLRRYWSREYDRDLAPLRVGGFVHSLARKAQRFWSAFIGAIFAIPALVALFYWRPRTRLLTLWIAIFFVGLTLEHFFFDHYAAPASAILMALITAGLAETWGIRWRRFPAGKWTVAAVCIACAGHVAGTAVYHVVTHRNLDRTFPAMRARVQRNLDSMGGKQLVLVRYSANHDVHQEWVFNRADIENAPTVWARCLNPDSDQDLIRHFANRTVWLFQPDARPPQLQLLSAEASAAASVRDVNPLLP